MIRFPSIELGSAMSAVGQGIAATASTVSHPFAAPEMSGAAPAVGIGGLGQVTLALALVVAAIFALAWLARRMRGFAERGAVALNVVAEVRVGPKERAVLLQAGTTQILVGVAPGSVRTLHVLPEPIRASAVTTAASERPSFRALLQKSLGK